VFRDLVVRFTFANFKRFLKNYFSGPINFLRLAVGTLDLLVNTVSILGLSTLRKLILGELTYWQKWTYAILIGGNLIILTSTGAPGWVIKFLSVQFAIGMIIVAYDKMDTVCGF